ncbi:MAG: hypothetical protein J6A04_03835 [Clostridia bacterium]|nr:hypothetical protein [Clostridia bacterium]
MLVEKIKGESPNETCKRCIKTYLESTGYQTFDYSKCSHCSISQIIHQQDSSVWNGHCRFLR